MNYRSFDGLVDVNQLQHFLQYLIFLFHISHPVF